MKQIEKNPRDLIAYQKAIKFSADIRNIVLSFPDYEKEVLSDQLRRSATSISSNIAESNPQYSLKNELKHYNIAFCSLRESQSQSQLELAQIAGYISLNTFKNLDEQAEEVARLIYGLMSYVKKEITISESVS